MILTRKILAILIALWTVLMIAVTLTTPMFAVEGPAIITIASGVLAYFIWPKNRTSRAHVASSDSA